MAGTRAKRPKAPPPRLNLEEMEHDPSMRGMLSFLEITPAEKLEMLRRRTEVDAATVSPFPAVPASTPEAGPPDFGAPELDSRVVDTPVVDAPVVMIEPEIVAANLDAPAIDAPISSAPTLAAPILDAPTLRPPIANAPPLKALEPVVVNTPTVDAPTFGPTTLGAPDLENIALYRPVRPKSRPANTAQDGHTHGEQTLFATLWRLARPAGQTGLRAIRIGERTLAAEVPMAYSTVQENLRALAAKLTIDIRLNGPQQPKTYLIYPDDEVLRRRRAAGLTHVIRRTSGVWLVHPDSNHLDAPDLGAPYEPPSDPQP